MFLPKVERQCKNDYYNLKYLNTRIKVLLK